MDQGDGRRSLPVTSFHGDGKVVTDIGNKTADNGLSVVVRPDGEPRAVVDFDPGGWEQGGDHLAHRPNPLRKSRVACRARSAAPAASGRAAQ